MNKIDEILGKALNDVYGLSKPIRSEDVRELKAALTRAGLAIVPVEPTHAMLHAGDAGGGAAGKCQETPVTEGVWQAMLSAAQSEADNDR